MCVCVCVFVCVCCVGGGGCLVFWVHAARRQRNSIILGCVRGEHELPLAHVGTARCQMVYNPPPSLNCMLAVVQSFLLFLWTAALLPALALLPVSLFLLFLTQLVYTQDSLSECDSMVTQQKKASAGPALCMCAFVCMYMCV